MIGRELDAPPRDLDLEMERAARILSGAGEVALACHFNPDADALGSMLGLALHLESLGKRVLCSWGNETLTRPRWLEVLEGGHLLVEPSQFPPAPGLLVTLDTAAPDRLGTLGAVAERAREVIVIDHHRTNPGFGSVLVLDPRASSTAELVFELLNRIGGSISPGSAACLYAGIVTDTGRFQYESTSPRTLRVAAELREHGVDHTRLAQALFEGYSTAFLRVLAVALARLVHVPEADLVWTYLTRQDLESVSATPGDTDDVIDVLRLTREADVACVLRQQGDGRFKVSLRSRGRTDVGALAKSSGGGGHRLASGYTSTTGVAGTVEALLDSLRRARGD